MQDRIGTKRGAFITLQITKYFYGITLEAFYLEILLQFSFVIKFPFSVMLCPNEANFISILFVGLKYNFEVSFSVLGAKSL